LEQTFPNEATVEKYPWRSFVTAEYSKIFWTYNTYKSRHGFSHDYPSLSCNGIVVKSFDEPYWERSVEIVTTPQLRQPAICVYDRDGHLPLNLQRTNLAARDEKLSDGLTGAIVDDLFAHALLQGPNEGAWGPDQHPFLEGTYPGFNSERRYSRFTSYYRWAFARDGYFLIDPFLIRAEKLPILLFLYFNSGANAAEKAATTNKIRKILPNNSQLIVCHALDMAHVNMTKFLYRSLLEWTGRFYAIPDMVAVEQRYNSSIPIDGAVSRVRRTTLRKVLRGYKPGKALREILRSAEAGGSLKDDWLRRPLGQYEPEVGRDFETNVAHLSGKGLEAFTICNVSWDEAEQNLLAKHWMGRLKNRLIPYAPHKRELAFSAFSKALEPYLASWKRELAERQKKAGPTEDMFEDAPAGPDM
jgi:hypothetical protein